MQRRTFVLSGLASLIALDALSSPRRAQAGACARPNDPMVAIMPTADDVIPRGEGFLVTLMPWSDRSLGPAAENGIGAGTAAMFEVGARLERDGAEAIPLRVVEIGPSVARLVPTRAPTPGRWRVVSARTAVPGGAPAPELTFGAAPAAPLAAIPRLSSVATIEVTNDGPGGGGTYRSTTAELASAVGMPAWQGIVAYQAASATSEWAFTARALNGTSPTQLLYADAGRCGFYVPGQSAAAVGSLVRVALYDLYGRVSTRSNQVRVGS